MLTQICQYLRNWFERDRIYGTFSVEDGDLKAEAVRLSDFLQIGQYYRVIGSVFNDGVHIYGDGDLKPERSFSGAVWPMAIPAELVELASEISKWINENRKQINSPYQSESFGGYSYSLKSGGSSDSEFAGITWQSHFAAQLAPWRKI